MKGALFVWGQIVGWSDNSVQGYPTWPHCTNGIRLHETT